MPTNFPGALDDFAPNPTPTDPRNNPSLAGKITNLSDAMEAVQATVGVTGSAVTSSLEYRVDALESAPATPAITDVVEQLTATRLASYNRKLVTQTAAYTATISFLSVFVCPMSFTTSNVSILVTVGGSGLPSVAEMGLYSMDASDNGTRIAVTASNLVWTGTGIQTYAWAAPVALTAGQRYAVSLYQGNGTGPTLAQLSPNSNGALLALRTPMSMGILNGSRAGASFVKAAVTQNSGYMYFELS
jgi:hypothetical protein